jgi:hypothetical protein|eukprot:COSAG06_NODE_11066_length_1573_cov_4.012212_1_plen_55_part_00
MYSVFLTQDTVHAFKALKLMYARVSAVPPRPREHGDKLKQLTELEERAVLHRNS